MRKILSLGLTLLLCQSLSAQETDADVIALKSKLAQHYPKLQLKNLQATEMKGLYSATLDDKVIYVNAQAEHLFVGSMIRLKDQKNLTKALVLPTASFDLNHLPLADAIKSVKGNGQRQLVIFSDPLCPYCQQLEKNLDALDNVTIYIFIVPLKTGSMAVSKNIWCAEQRSFVWQQWMRKQVAPTKQEQCETPLQRNMQLAQKLGLTGTPMLVFANGQSVQGAFSAVEIEKVWQQMAAAREDY